jgi:hypothetical protein
MHERTDPKEEIASVEYHKEDGDADTHKEKDGSDDHVSDGSSAYVVAHSRHTMTEWATGYASVAVILKLTTVISQLSHSVFLTCRIVPT